MDAFVTPALALERVDNGQQWQLGRGWGDDLGPAELIAEGEPPMGGGEVWVRPHVRDGKPVAGHWRGSREG